MFSLVWNPALEARPRRIIDKYGAYGEALVCMVELPPAEQAASRDAASSLPGQGEQPPEPQSGAPSTPALPNAEGADESTQAPGFRTKGSVSYLHKFSNDYLSLESVFNSLGDLKEITAQINDHKPGRQQIRVF